MGEGEGEEKGKKRTYIYIHDMRRMIAGKGEVI